MTTRFSRQPRKVDVQADFAPTCVEAWVLDTQATCADCGSPLTTLFIYGGDVLCWTCAAYRNPEFARAEASYAQQRAKDATALVQRLDALRATPPVDTHKERTKQNVVNFQRKRKSR